MRRADIRPPFGKWIDHIWPSSKILVIAGETLSKVTDYTDRTTCVLFGDAAGALLVERDEETPGFLASVQGTSGNGGDILYRAGLRNEINGVQLVGSGKWCKTDARYINGPQEPSLANLNGFYIKQDSAPMISIGLFLTAPTCA